MYRMLLVLLASLFIASAAHAHSGETFTIKVTDDGFAPNEIIIKQSDTIVYVNAGHGPHWPASNIHPTHRGYPGSDIDKCDTDKAGDTFDACGGIAPGEGYSFTFTEEGTWRYHDHLFPNLAGKITVLADENGDTETNTVTVSVIGKLLGRVKDFFAKMTFYFQKDAGRPYDAAISEDSTTIFTDEDALYSYIKKFGPSKTTEHLYAISSQFGDCHTPAHDAGRLSYEIYGTKSFQLCSAECHSGCYHGATESFFSEHGTANLADNLATICDSELNPFFSHQCIHGIGHGLMAWSNYAIFEALEGCDLLPKGFGSCYSGVFMENIVGGLAQEQGHFTEYLNDDPHMPCTVVPEKYKGACYYYQSSRMMQLFNGDFTQVAATCLEAPSEYHHWCFESMGRDVGGVHRNDPTGAIAACSEAPLGEHRTDCLSGAVQDSFWAPSGQDNALTFCKLLTNSEEKENCYRTIFARALNVLVVPQEHTAFCNRAEENYREQCLSHL